MKRSILIKMMNENIVSITDKGIVVDVQLLLPFLTREQILPILYEQDGNTYLRALVEKWDFQDVMMGEQYISFNISSSKPIEWEVGDFCFFRGEVFTLNYKPSVTQNAKIGETGKAFEYDNVKFDSPQEELTRCQLLDITATTGQYVPAQGTNYTGSSHFPLYCGETTVEIGGKLVTYTAVCVLAAKMQANLDRLYPNKGWQVLVDTTSTYKDSEGNDVLVTHTDDKVLQFDNKYVSDALAEVHNTFELDYYVRGRIIYIGYKLDNLTEGLGGEAFAFGYGAGYPSAEDSGKGLFQIKKISDSQQKIVTRLRALGSTKNLPYRYYNKKYNLSQALFPLNLQLPDTFIPEGTTADAAGANTKWGHNKLRNQTLRAVKGDTNDSYIDKNDDAEHCSEGIREDSAKWDGSTDGLPEIYPTIEGAKYKELRDALVEDQDGNIGQGSFPKYLDEERIDELLAIGYLSNGTLIDDANKGDGILAENGEIERGLAKTTKVPTTRVDYPTSGLTPVNYEVIGNEVRLFTVSGVTPGRYAMAPTEGNHVMYGCRNVGSNFGALQVGYIIYIRQKNVETGVVTDIATYKSDTFSVATADDVIEVELPKIPDSEQETPKVSEIRVTEFSDVIVSFAPYIANVRNGNVFTFDYYIDSPEKKYNPEYVWFPLDGSMSISDTFHVFIKDMGFDITACFTEDSPVVAMKSGKCVGREFEIGENVEKVTYNGYKGYMLTLSRATDNSLNTYYPSATDPIAAGDNFVLLNINMPEVFIKLAEVRLLRAATDYLADNSDTQFSYQPVISCNYLQRNYDRTLSAGTPEASILWRLYAGLKFSFRGIPSDSDSPLPTADITIERVVIHMGDGATPKVDITLNDDVQQTTLQKLTSTVDRIYNGSLAGGGIGGASTANVLSLIQSEGKKRFLSKKEDDSTPHKLTMGEAEVTGDAEVGGDTTLDGDLNVNGTTNLNNTNISRGSNVSFGRDGDYIENEQGGRVSVDADGLVRAQVDYLQVNRKMTAKEVEIQEVTHLGGKVVYTAARMKCVKVEEVTAIVQQRRVVVGYKCYFENDDGEGQHIYNQFRVGDQAYCETWNLGGGTSSDFSNQFYWRLVTEVGDDYIVVSADDCAADSTIPRAGDDIVQLGYRKQQSDTDAEALARQGAIIQTAAESVIDGNKVSVPSISLFKGINSYVLPRPFILFSPSESHISSTTIVLSSGETIEQVLGTGFNVYRSSQWDARNDREIIYPTPTGNAPDDPSVDWTTDELKEAHDGDIYLSRDGIAWQWKKVDNTYQWSMVTDAALLAYLQELMSKPNIYQGDTEPTNYRVGDIWVKPVVGDANRANEVFFCVSDYDGEYKSSDWQSPTDVARVYADSVVNTAKEALETQIDGKIDCWYQNTDPSTAWTTDEEKMLHVGDQWYEIRDGQSSLWYYRHDSTNNTFTWSGIRDKDALLAHTLAKTAQDTADGKRRVFTTTPTPPYDEGDLWCEGALGDIKICRQAKTSGQQYDVTDWQPASKYTDDSALLSFQRGEYAQYKQGVATQLGVYGSQIRAMVSMNLYKTVTQNYVNNHSTLTFYVVKNNDFAEATTEERATYDIQKYELVSLVNEAGLVIEDNLASLVASSIGTDVEITAAIDGEISKATIKADKVIIGTNDNNKGLNEVLVVQGNYVKAQNLAVEGFLNRGVARIAINNLNTDVCYKNEDPTQIAASKDAPAIQNTSYSLDLLMLPDIIEFTSQADAPEGAPSTTTFILPSVAMISGIMNDPSYIRPYTRYNSDGGVMTLAQMRALIGRKFIFINNTNTTLVFVAGVKVDEANRRTDNSYSQITFDSTLGLHGKSLAAFEFKSEALHNANAYATYTEFLYWKQTKASDDGATPLNEFA